MILGYFLFMVGVCLLFTVVLAALSADTLTVVYRNNGLQLGQTPLMLLRQILAAQWIFIVVGGVFVVVAGMFITHRMAGPLFRLERALDNMVSGKLDDVIFLRRKDEDEGKEIAAKLNQFNHDLSEKIRQIESCSKSIGTLLLQNSALDPSNAAPRDDIQSIHGSIACRPADGRRRSVRDDIQSIHGAIAAQNRTILAITQAFQLLDE